MEQFASINVTTAWQKLQHGEAILVDIRDSASYVQHHVNDSYHLTDSTLVEFQERYDFEQPIMVICYHGNSSKGAAQFLINHGYETVYSVDGGFEQWGLHYPESVVSG